MEYLVTMATRVPAGTAEASVADVRTREAARSRELAAQGHLLRLWRPPVRPGEWRTLGLFAASEEDQLEQILASMPLRVWRTDEVMPLSAHQNDPEHAAEAGQETKEFLTTFTATAEPAQAQAVADAKVLFREAGRAQELAAEGHLERLWQLPSPGRLLGLWRATDAVEMHAIVKSLPLDPWRTTEITPLGEHPSDPAINRG
jgi:muconolactone delta-isomerase